MYVARSLIEKIETKEKQKNKNKKIRSLDECNEEGEFVVHELIKNQLLQGRRRGDSIPGVLIG